MPDEKLEALKDRRRKLRTEIDRLEVKLSEVEEAIRRRERDPAPAPEVVKKGDTGPDVSSYQGSVDWAKVAGQCNYAFVKATEGRTFKDSSFTGARLEAMGKEDLAIGAYHFARPDNNQAEHEVEHFVKTVQSAGGKFISLKDWREGKPGVLGVMDFEHQPFSATWAAAWGKEFEERTSVKAVAYGYGSSLEPIKGTLAGSVFSGVWIAGYPNYAGYSGPAPFLHQYTDRGSCAGISGPCDMNRVLA